MKLNKFVGPLVLLLTSLIWGASFVAQSEGMNHVGPFTFQAVRSLLGSAVLIPVILIRRKFKSEKNILKKGSNTKKLWISGIMCGIILCVAACLQQIGINMGTSAGKSGFITAFYVILVPVIGLFFNKKVHPKIWVCVGLALCGLYLLCITDSFSLQVGDLFVLLSSLFFAFHIILIDGVAQVVDDVKLSAIQFFICGSIALIPALIIEQPTFSVILDGWISILYAGVLSCGVAYTFQIIGQKRTQPTVASLILSLESVFAVLTGMIILKEIPTPREVLGCSIMFLAIILAVLPNFSVKRKKK